MKLPRISRAGAPLLNVVVGTEICFGLISILGALQRSVPKGNRIMESKENTRYGLILLSEGKALPPTAKVSKMRNYWKKQTNKQLKQIKFPCCKTS